MASSLVASIPSLAIGFIVLFVTWIAAKFAVRIAARFTGRTKMRASLQNLIETVTRLVIWLVGLLIALTVMLPGLSPSGLIAGLGLGTVAIGFAFQDIFENFLAGVLIMMRDKMEIGDSIEVEGIIGKVEHITLRETHIRQFTGELTVVPNSMLFKNPVKIMTDQPLRRWEINVGVSYDTDLDHAHDVIRQALTGIEDISAEKPLDIYVKEFGASSVDFMVRWWCGAKPRDMFAIRDDMFRRIKRALDEESIEIPFPYITHTFKEPIPLPGPSGS